MSEFDEVLFRERDCMLLQILDLHASSFMRDQLWQMLTDAGVPIYNSGGGSITLAGRIETYFGWRARFPGPNPFGMYSNQQGFGCSKEEALGLESRDAEGPRQRPLRTETT